MPHSVQDAPKSPTGGPKDDGEYRAVPSDDTVEPFGIDDERGKRGPSTNYPRAVAAIIIYCLAGPCLIFLNKHILVNVEFPYGSALSLMGVVMSTVLSSGALLLGLASSEQVVGMTPWFYVTRILPIGVALGLCLATGNMACVAGADSLGKRVGAGFREIDLVRVGTSTTPWRSCRSSRPSRPSS